jgi:hypothetical protein
MKSFVDALDDYLSAREEFSRYADENINHSLRKADASRRLAAKELMLENALKRETKP